MNLEILEKYIPPHIYILHVNHTCILGYHYGRYYVMFFENANDTNDTDFVVRSLKMVGRCKFYNNRATVIEGDIYYNYKKKAYCNDKITTHWWSQGYNDRRCMYAIAYDVFKFSRNIHNELEKLREWHIDAYSYQKIPYFDNLRKLYKLPPLFIIWALRPRLPRVIIRYLILPQIYFNLI